MIAQIRADLELLEVTFDVWFSELSLYENEHYHTMKGKLPKEGQKVSTTMGVASVVGSNTLKETVLVELESQATVELPLSEVTILDY